MTLEPLVRLAVRVHLLDSSQLLAPSATLETLITTFLATALYLVLKLHYRKAVVAPLRWLLPSRFYTAISILGGVAAALAITYLTRWRGHVMPAIAAKDFLVLGLFLGPILEESVFRGCLLPVLTRTLGNVISVLATSALFAAFHAPGRCHTLSVIYRYRCSIWFTALGVADDHGSRIHACDLQFDSFPLCQAVIALCGIVVVTSSKTRFRNRQKSPRTGFRLRLKSARLDL